MNLRCRKVSSHGLENLARLQEARARWLYELAVQECKLVRVSRLGRVGRGTSEVARRTCGAGKKVNTHGLADPARLQGARAWWLNELAVQESKLARVSEPGKESKLARVSEPGKVTRGTSEVVRRSCGAGKKVSSHGLANLARLQEARARWFGDLAVQEINTRGLADPARLQEARARWLGELAAQESKLARVSRSGKVAKSTGEVARRTCGSRK
ncbi:hypothetical protein CRG98_016683 [Punica granatum]|uniref:Uncharacterized protein n=1 Tax=Punica granatum TaxID=22663 RepID=A0A2I0K302_PUNGR|nr:hypothetical protein CRG98_016683 [Punica granatum]